MHGRLSAGQRLTDQEGGLSGDGGMSEMIKDK